ncbi:hypothetical protein HWD03_gp079 [Alteromonas phage vB_AmeM_PT11-V22]|uniref:Uncharacterized protein n=1 Tax=Alteromonas phage vB_AmeM_PT11-V22 TaxID=2704031 RepID=A0A6C0R0S3_9CAUD|nr:hypothetical protein HWD03_gp079 [Alteromonas phage vB_AmeM_PT11-V22]QHZ59839.1 hypothetical protein [Alteromonas phage vB_AmeM_PT11-V22]
MYLVSTNKTIEGSTGYFVRSHAHFQVQLANHPDCIYEQLGVVGSHKKVVNVEEDKYGHIEVDVVYSDVFGDLDCTTFYLLKLQKLGEG